MTKYLILEKGKLLNIEANTMERATDLVDKLAYMKKKVPAIDFSIAEVPDTYDKFVFTVEKQARDFRHRAENVVAVADRIVLTGIKNLQESFDNTILYWLIRENE